MTLTTKVTTSVLAALILTLLTFIWIQSRPAAASVPVSHEYMATTTGNATVYGVTITGDQLLKIGQGALGQVTVTGANTGIFNLYDATTTDVTKRTGNKATTTILIASFPASLVAGTYLYDVAFTDGLYVDYMGGLMPTSTIMYR